MTKKEKSTKKGFIILGINIICAILVTLLILLVLISWLKNYTQHDIEMDVPDVRGLFINDADLLLGSQELRLVVIDSTHSEKVPLGTIVEQDPIPNSKVKKGRMVYVTINATTKRQIIMPNLQDMSYRQAEITLKSMGLVVDSIYEYKPSEFRDLVLDIKSAGVSIGPGQKVEVGTKVKLVVGFGRGIDKVEVPNIIGLSLQDARSLLLSHRLTIGATYYDEPDKTNELQYIYNQFPAAGEMLVEGETVSIYLSIDQTKSAKYHNTTENEEEEWF